jgi:hypothetical protein
MVTRLLELAHTIDRNRIKPGIAEATAPCCVMPERLLIRDRDD